MTGHNGPRSDDPEASARERILRRGPSDEPILKPRALTPILTDDVLTDPQEAAPVVPEAPSVEPEPAVTVAPPPVTVTRERPSRRRTPRPIAVARPRSPKTIAHGLDRAARITLAAGLFLVPVVFDRHSVDAFNLVKVTVLWSVAVIVVGLLLALMFLDANERLNLHSRTIRIALLLLAVTGVATMFSPSRTLSIFGLYHRYGGLASLAVYVVIAALIVRLYMHRYDALSVLALAVVAAACVVSLYVLVQRAGIDPFHWRLGAGNTPATPIGNLGNSEFTGAYLAIAAPFVLYSAILARTLTARIAWAIAGVGVIVALFATGSRVGLLAAIGGLVAVVVFASRMRSARKLIVVVVMLLGASLVPALVGSVSNSSDRASFGSESVSYRAEEWKAAGRMVLRRPVIGWGPETYFGNYGRFRSADDARVRGLIMPDKPHNIFLEWAVSTGVVGLLVYLTLIGSVLWLVAERGPRLPRGPGLLAASFGGALVAYLVQGLFSVDVPPLAVMGWAAVGAAGALGGSGVDADDTGAAGAPTGGTRARRGLWLLAAAAPVVVAVGLVAAGLGPLRADYAVWAADRGAANWSEDAARLHDKAIHLNPHEAAYLSLAAAYYERLAGAPGTPMTKTDALERAVALYERAAKLQPRNLYFMLDAVRVHARLGRSGGGADLALADDWMTRAVNLDPLDPQVRQIHASILTQWAAATKEKYTRDSLVARARDEARIASALRDGRPVKL